MNDRTNTIIHRKSVLAGYSKVVVLSLVLIIGAVGPILDKSQQWLDEESRRESVAWKRPMTSSGRADEDHVELVNLCLTD